MTEPKKTLYARWDCHTTFDVPDEIDLEDNVNVAWYIKHNTLYIETRDGKTYEIEGSEPLELKYPEEITLYDRETNTEEDIQTNPRLETPSESEDEDDESDSHTSDQEH